MVASRFGNWLFATVVLCVAATAWGEDWQTEAAADRGTSEAVKRAAAEFGETGTWSEIQAGQSVRVPYDEKEPVLLCAPLRISSIVLEPGETVLEAIPGDAAHWQILRLHSGPGGDTPVVGVRPTLDIEDSCDKTTNLVITTDRRLYTVILELAPCQDVEGYERNPQRVYHNRLSFFYPEKLVQRWTTRAQLRARQEREEVVAAEELVTRSVGNVDDLNFGYRVKKKNGFPWEPQVFDNGKQTFIRIPDSANEIGTVFERRGSEDAVVNFSVVANGSVLVLPKIYDELAMVLASGARLKVLKRQSNE